MSWKDTIKESSWRDTVTEETSALESAVQGAFEGASLGWRDELAGALEAGGQFLGVKGLGGKFSDIGLQDSIDADQLGKVYEETKQRRESELSKAQQANPEAFLAGNLAGGLVTSIAVPNPATLGGRIAMGAGTGALAGAGQADEGRALQGAALGGILGGAAVPAAEKIGSLLSAGARASGEILKDVTDKYGPKTAEGLGRFIGLSKVDAKKVADYAKNPNIYKNTKTPEEIKNIIDDLNLQKVIQKDNSQSAFIESTKKLNDTLGDWRENINSSMGAFKDSANLLKNSFRDTTPNPEIFNKLDDAVISLKNDITKGSQLASEILDSEGVFVQNWEIRKIINSAAESLKIEGVAPDSQSAPTFSYLKNKLKEVERLPEALKGSSVKKIIQDLDGEIQYANSSGDISSRANRAVGFVRRELDEMLKNKSPNYKKVMGEVSALSKNLDRANKMFGTGDRAAQRLASMGLDKQSSDLAFLKEISPESRELLNEYLYAKQSLKPQNFPIAKMELPEFNQLPEYVRDIYSKAGRLPNSFEIKQLEQQLFKDLIAENELVGKSFSDINKKFTSEYISPQESESIIKSYLNPQGPRIETAKRLTSMEDVSGSNIGKELEQELRRTAVSNVFESPSGGIINQLKRPILKKTIDATAFTTDMVGKLLKAAPEKLGKYHRILNNSAERGINSVAITDYLLSQQDPEYREMKRQLDENR